MSSCIYSLGCIFGGDFLWLKQSLGPPTEGATPRQSRAPARPWAGWVATVRYLEGTVAPLTHETVRARAEQRLTWRSPCSRRGYLPPGAPSCLLALGPTFPAGSIHTDLRFLLAGCVRSPETTKISCKARGHPSYQRAVA